MKNRFLSQKGIAAGYLVLSLAFVAFGIVFANLAQQGATIQDYAKTWPTTEAVLKTLNTEGFHEGQAPVIAYTYEVKGKTYEGHRLFLSPEAREKILPGSDGITVTLKNTEAQEITYNYKQGDKITIRHNPERPEDSVIHPVYVKDHKLFLIGGILLVLVGMLLGVRALSED